MAAGRATHDMAGSGGVTAPAAAAGSLFCGMTAKACAHTHKGAVKGAMQTGQLQSVTMGWAVLSGLRVGAIPLPSGGRRFDTFLTQ